MRKSGKVLIVGEWFDLFKDNVIVDLVCDFCFLELKEIWLKDKFVGDYRVVCFLFVVLINWNGFIWNCL